MSRRVFLQPFTALLGGFALPALPQPKLETNRWKTLQISPVAGFQYHRGEALWPQLATGQPVTLIREPGNRFGQRTVRIGWQGEKLGYIPAKDNAAISQLLDREEKLSALIVGLKKSNNPWERIEVKVRWRE